MRSFIDNFRAATLFVYNNVCKYLEDWEDNRIFRQTKAELLRDGAEIIEWKVYQEEYEERELLDEMAAKLEGEELIGFLIENKARLPVMYAPNPDLEEIKDPLVLRLPKGRIVIVDGPDGLMQYLQATSGTQERTLRRPCLELPTETPTSQNLQSDG